MQLYIHLHFLLLVLLPCCPFGQSQFVVADCYSECNFEAAIQPDASCAQLQSTLDCYDLNFDLCDGDYSVDNVIVIFFDAIDNCNTQPISTFECPATLSSVLGTPIDDAEEADIFPESHSCAIAPPDSFRQCSMYTHSHMRPFKGYRTGLETCTIPGEWYLLKHSNFTVVVESGPVPGFNLTQLTKVNVTFLPTSCSEGKSYVATIESPLPQTFTDGQLVNNSDSALQLNHKSSVVSLLAVWINTTIVIRKFPDTLSITMQVPGDVAFFSEGLCLGCPRQAYFNVSRYIEDVRSQCDQETTRNTLFNCFFLANQDEFDDINNNTYVDHCTFEMFMTESLDTRRVLKAIAQDAKMLPDLGTVPIRITPSVGPTPPIATTRFMSVTPTASSKSDPDTSTTRHTSQEETIFGSASSISSLNILTVMGLAVIGLVT